MKVFVTSMALTKGIIEAECISRDDDKALVLLNPGSDHRTVLSRGDWAETMEEAVEIAEEMRIAKLQHLNAQIKYVSSVKF